MNKKLYTVFVFCIIVLIHSASAQCPAGRYLYNGLFSSFTVETDTYSTANSSTLLVDVYQPTGDTLAKRPLIILAHGGSFISGNRTDDSTIDWLCWNFAKRGYVTASIEYRLGNIISMITDSSYAIDVVMKAISDGKAAIRYFVKDASTVNHFRIDTNNIFIGGNSAGAVLYMHAGYIDSLGECPSYIQTAMLANGGFEGNSGNSGFTTKSKAIINLAGALNEVSMAGPGDKPSVNAQGDADATVPYECGLPLSGQVHVTLCGLGQLEPRYDSMGIYHMSHVFPGQGHVPWSTDPAMFVTVDSMVTLFLYDLMCVPTSIREVNALPQINLFPNPANEVINITANENVKDIVLTDELGRTVVCCRGIDALNCQLNTSLLPAGIYLIKISFANEGIAPIVKKIAIY